MRARRWSVLFLLGWMGIAWSAPITFNTALPVQEKGWILREQFVERYEAEVRERAQRDRTAPKAGELAPDFEIECLTGRPASTSTPGMPRSGDMSTFPLLRLTGEYGTRTS